MNPTTVLMTGDSGSSWWARLTSARASCSLPPISAILYAYCQCAVASLGSSSKAFLNSASPPAKSQSYSISLTPRTAWGRAKVASNSSALRAAAFDFGKFSLGAATNDSQ